MPFPLIPVLISAITGATGLLVSKIQAGGVGGVRRFLPTTAAPPAIAVPPIIGRIGGAIADVAGAVAGGFLGTGAPTAFGCPPGRAVRQKGCRIDPCTGKVETFFLDTGCVVKKRRRRRGITATELRGFNKLNALLARIGKVPARPRRKVC